MNMSSTVKRVYLSDEYAILVSSNELANDDQDDWEIIVSFLARSVVYITILVVVTIVVSLIIKFLKDCDDRVHREAAEVEQESETTTETNRLLPNLKDSNSGTYGTMEADDLESGNSSSSSDELYDGKICIICYDQHRNCFFVPCGHSATCYDCAQRIMDGEGKKCPVCRRLVRKVRKMFTS
ncbi:hypothetical protein LguiB_009312 [Lonicera macranthoides]